MRTRTTVAAVAAVSGALALCALSVPAAQADGGWGDTTITKVVVDGDNKVSVGISAAKTIKVGVTATDDSGIAGADSFTLEGPDYGFLMTGRPTCTEVGSTISTCSASVLVDPKVDYLSNANAGTWYVGAWIDANDGDWAWEEKAGSFAFQRASKLTVNASPEPVRKGSTLTVSGKLTRADWQNLKYVGLPSGQSVTLQFRKAGSSTYTNVKTVKTTTGGALKTTVTAASDGYWRFSYAGITSTAAATATGDYVDVQ
jgi:hypothetical protein